MEFDEHGNSQSFVQTEVGRDHQTLRPVQGHQARCSAGCASGRAPPSLRCTPQNVLSP